MADESEILKDDLSLPPVENYSEILNSVPEKVEDKKPLFFIYPAIIALLLLLGIPAVLAGNTSDSSGFLELGTSTGHGNFSINILSESDLSVGVKDTVYTDKECWLELRIDQQMLYQHWRNGKTDKYAISSGNKFLEKGIESRPGLFAIFAKEQHHESTQFNNADMYYFMPFNMGIGFHSLDGTGYYGNLGVRPSSHGCIRMRHEDVKKVFSECPIGTIVLAHRGYTARTVGFAPKDFENKEEISKDEFKYMLSENLMNILNGDFYMKERKFFVIDPKVIPVSWIYISYDHKIPERQKLSKSTYIFLNNSDRLCSNICVGDLKENDSQKEIAELIDDVLIDEKDLKKEDKTDYLSDAELIRKYFHNPIGILPYFPPDKK